MVRTSDSGVPDLPSVMSRRLNAGLFSIPMMSGYGPAVSVAVTAHEDPVVVVVVVGDVLVALVGEPPQADKNPPTAAPIVPSASRRVRDLVLPIPLPRGKPRTTLSAPL